MTTRDQIAAAVRYLGETSLKTLIAENGFIETEEHIDVVLKALFEAQEAEQRLRATQSHLIYLGKIFPSCVGVCDEALETANGSPFPRAGLTAAAGGEGTK